MVAREAFSRLKGLWLGAIGRGTPSCLPTVCEGSVRLPVAIARPEVVEGRTGYLQRGLSKTITPHLHEIASGSGPQAVLRGGATSDN